MIDASYILFAGTIYALGFIGLFGVPLLPLRSFLLLRRQARRWHTAKADRIALLLIASVAIVALMLSTLCVEELFRCLTDMRCGPNRASGWLRLCFIGMFYLGFEAISQLVLIAVRRLTCAD